MIPNPILAHIEVGEEGSGRGKEHTYSSANILAAWET